MVVYRLIIPLTFNIPLRFGEIARVPQNLLYGSPAIFSIPVVGLSFFQMIWDLLKMLDIWHKSKIFDVKITTYQVLFYSKEAVSFIDYAQENVTESLGCQKEVKTAFSHVGAWIWMEFTG